MKIQQKLDRALESFIRINATDWKPDLEEKEREKINAQIKALIKATREGKDKQFIDIVGTSDKARAPADELRKINERRMEELAEQLPVYETLIKPTPGLGALGLATIVAETGDLSNYPNIAKVWKRLGFAPYDGCAGSTWKRETWRPRKLTSEEWIDNPFSGERYALIHQVAVWLRNKQWIGAAKTEDGKGKPNGEYGDVYAKRRAHTAVTHPDWTPGHADKDAIRVMMKYAIKRIWAAWHVVEFAPMRSAKAVVKPNLILPSATNSNTDVRPVVKSIPPLRPSRSAKGTVKSKSTLPSASSKTDAISGLKSESAMRPSRSANSRLKTLGPLPSASKRTPSLP